MLWTEDPWPTPPPDGLHWSSQEMREAWQRQRLEQQAARARGFLFGVLVGMGIGMAIGAVAAGLL